VASIARSSNPYRPSWGTPPPVLAGRDELLGAAVDALDVGPRHPLFSHVYHGDRGTGKTVLLDALGARAAARGWPVVPLACREGTGLVEALVELHLPALLRQLRGRRVRGAATSVRGVVGVPALAQVTATAAWTPGQRSLGVELERLLAEVGHAAAAKPGLRVLVTVDELHAIDARFDLPSLAGVLQLVTQRRGLPVALVGAGLPDVVQVLSGRSVTFLERLRKLELGYLDPDATKLALLGPVQALGVPIDVDALELLARASSGYPYYVQLLGWETWAAAAADRSPRIARRHAQRGLDRAEQVVVEQVFEPRFLRLAPREREYLVAMAADGDAGTTTADLVARLGVARANDISYLRDRLLAKHVIRAAGRGRVTFTLPGMATWLRRSPPPV
jgi:hypothetical protein